MVRHSASLTETSTSGRPARGRASQVVDQLRELIVRGGVADGSFLGTEGELVTCFRVSRPCLREALRRLEGEGLIEVAIGVGGGVKARRPGLHQTTRAVAGVLRARDIETADQVGTYARLAALTARGIAGARRHRINALELRSVIPETPTALEPCQFAEANREFQRALIERGVSPTMNLLTATLQGIIDAQSTPDGTHATFGVSALRQRHARAQHRFTELMEHGLGAETETFWNRYLLQWGRSITSRTMASAPILDPEIGSLGGSSRPPARLGIVP